MIIGVPKEIKNNENRVGMTPAGVAELVKKGHTVYVQLIDAYSNCGICEKFEVIGGRGKYLKDGLHPDVEGQTLEGAFASKEIRNNYF